MGNARGIKKGTAFARALLCVFLSAAMVVGLAPGYALAADPAQPVATASGGATSGQAHQQVGADAPVTTNDKATGSGSVTVKGYSYNAFQLDKYDLSATAIRVADLATATLKLQFTGGAPMEIDDPDNEGEKVLGYKLDVTYTKYALDADTQLGTGGTYHAVYKGDTSTPEMTMTIAELISDQGDDSKVGRYKFAITMMGATTATNGNFVPEVTVYDGAYSITAISADVGENGEKVSMHGAFSNVATLSATDLGSTEKGPLAVGMGPVQELAAGDDVLCAYQLDIVNETATQADPLYEYIRAVTLPVTVAQAASIIGLDSGWVLGNKSTGFYALSITAKGEEKKYYETPEPAGIEVAADADGNIYKIAEGVTVKIPKDRSQPAYVTFPARSTGTYGIAVPVLEGGKVDVVATAENGIVTGGGKFPKGRTVTLQLNPFEGYVLDSPEITLSYMDGSDQTDASSVIGSAVSGDKLQLTIPADYEPATLDVFVKFAAYISGDPGDPTKTYPVKVNAVFRDKDNNETTATSDHGTFTAKATVFKETDGVTSESPASFGPATGEEMAAFDAIEGTAVYLNMSPAEGRRVATVRIQTGGAGPVDVGSPGITSYMVSSVADETTVTIVFEDGTSSPTQSKTLKVIGEVVSGKGGFSVDENGVISNAYEAEVTYGSYQLVPVFAAENHRIESVYLYPADKDMVPDESAGVSVDIAKQREFYEVSIPNVTTNWLVRTSFEHMPVTFTLAECEHGTAMLIDSDGMSVTGEDGIYTVPYSETDKLTLTVKPDEGYKLHGVTVDGESVQVVLAEDMRDNGDGSYSLEIVPNRDVKLTPTFTEDSGPIDPEYINVVIDSNGDSVGNGEVKPPSPQKIEAGGKLTLEFTADKGYQVASVTVTAGETVKTDTSCAGKWSWIFDSAPYASSGITDILLYVKFEKAGSVTPPDPPTPDEKAKITLCAIGGSIQPSGEENEDGEYVYETSAGKHFFALLPDTDHEIGKVLVNMGDGLGRRDVTYATAQASPDAYMDGRQLAIVAGKGAKISVLVEFTATAPVAKVQYMASAKVAGNREFGTVSPEGVTYVKAGQQQSFTFVPKAPAGTRPHDKYYELESVVVYTGSQVTPTGDVAAGESGNGIVMTSQVTPMRTEDGRAPSGGVLTLTFDSDMLVVASFAEKELGDDGKTEDGENPPKPLPSVKVKVAEPIGGTVYPQGEQVLYADSVGGNIASSLTYTFVADCGQALSRIERTVKKAGESRGTLTKIYPSQLDSSNGAYAYTIPADLVADYVSDSGEGSIELSAVFAKVAYKYTVTVTAVGPAGATDFGYVSPGCAPGETTGEMSLPMGSSQTFYFITRAGYKVKSVIVKSKETDKTVEGVTQLTVNDIRSRTSIVVEYEEAADGGDGPQLPESKTHAISSSVDGNGGSIVPFGVNRAAIGGNMLYTFAPDPGYYLVDIIVDGKSVKAAANGNTYQFQGISEDHAISAKFAPISPGATKYAPMTTSSTSKGSVTPDSSLSLGTGGASTARAGTTIAFKPNDADSVTGAALDPAKVDLDSVTLTVMVADSATGLPVTKANSSEPVTAKVTLTADEVDAVKKNSWTLNTADVPALANYNDAVKRACEAAGYKVVENATTGVAAKVLAGSNDSANPSRIVASPVVAMVGAVDAKFTGGGQNDSAPADSAPSAASRVPLTASAGNGGSVGPTFISAVPGKDYTFFVVPDADYRVDEVDAILMLEEPGHPSNDCELHMPLIPNLDGSYTVRLEVPADVGEPYTSWKIREASIGASFKKNENTSPADAYDIMVVNGEGGTVYPGADAGGTGIVHVSRGASQTFEFAADDGYRIAMVSVACGGIVSNLADVGTSFTLHNVHANVTLTVIWAAIGGGDPDEPSTEAHGVMATATEGGKITPSGMSTVSHFGSLSFEVEALEGYKLSHIVIDEGTDLEWFMPASYIADGVFVLGPIERDQTVKAVFVEESGEVVPFTTYSFVMDGNGASMGYVTPSYTMRVKEGDHASARAVPYYGYRLAGVRVVGVDGERAMDLTAQEMLEGADLDRMLGFVGAAAFEVHVAFAPSGGGADSPAKQYSIAAFAKAEDGSSVVGGEISPSGTMLVNGGSDQTFGLIPASGYKVSRVLANGSEVAVLHGENGSYFTAYAIDTNMSIEAYFAPMEAGEESSVTKTVPVGIRAVGEGSITPSGLVQVIEGQSLTVTMAPRAGYRLGTLVVNGHDVTSRVRSLSYVIGPDEMKFGTAIAMDEISRYQCSVVATFIGADGTRPSTGGDVDVFVEMDVERETSEGTVVDKGSSEGGRVSPMHAAFARGGSRDFIIMPNDGYVVTSAEVVRGNDTDELAMRPVSDAAVSDEPAVRMLAAARTANADAGSVRPMSYRYVTVSGIDQNVILRVLFKKADDSQAPYIVYDPDSIRDATPHVIGGVAVTPGSDELIMKTGDSKSITLMPVGKDANGRPNAIVTIAVNGESYPVGGYADAGGPGVLVDNGDGSYTLTIGFNDLLPASQGGGIEVVATGVQGADALYQHAVSLADISVYGGMGTVCVERVSTAYTLISDGQVIKVSNNGVIKVTATSTDAELYEPDYDEPFALSPSSSFVETAVPTTRESAGMLSAYGATASASRYYRVLSPGSIAGRFLLVGVGDGGNGGTGGGNGNGDGNNIPVVNPGAGEGVGSGNVPGGSELPGTGGLPGNEPGDGGNGCGGNGSNGAGDNGSDNVSGNVPGNTGNGNGNGVGGGNGSADNAGNGTGNGASGGAGNGGGVGSGNGATGTDGNNGVAGNGATGGSNGAGSGNGSSGGNGIATGVAGGNPGGIGTGIDAGLGSVTGAGNGSTIAESESIWNPSWMQGSGQSTQRSRGGTSLPKTGGPGAQSGFAKYNKLAADGFRVNVSAGSGGRISLDSQKADTISKVYRVGQTASINLHPNMGCEVKTVTINGQKNAWSSDKIDIVGEGATEYNVYVEFGEIAAAGPADMMTKVLKTVDVATSTGSIIPVVVMLGCALLLGSYGSYLLLRRRVSRIQKVHFRTA